MAGPPAAVPPPPRAFPGAALPPPRPGLARKTTGNDGWGSDETSFHKMGNYVVMIPAILGAVFASGVIGHFISPMIIGAVVGICGIVGGLINLWGRGPMVMGAAIGLVLAVGGYGGVYGWLQVRGGNAYWFECIIAFVIGASPGIGLQK